MSDRRLFDTSAPIPKGHYQTPMRLDRAALPDGPMASQFGAPTPVARFGKAGLDVTSGAEGLRTAKSMSMSTAPVAMRMGDMRRAHKAGLLAGAGVGGNLARKAEIRQHGLTASFGIVIDLSDLARLGDRLGKTSAGIVRGHAIVSRAINDGLRKFDTVTTAALQQWTGIKRKKRIRQDYKHTWSTPATMTAKLKVSGRHTRVTTQDYGASWSRANPGGTHKAWNRSQLARGTFMIKGGKGTRTYAKGRKAGTTEAISSIRDDLLFFRPTNKRLPIFPLFGPAMAREVQRHEAQVQATLNGVVRTHVVTAATRMMSAAIAKSGG